MQAEIERVNRRDIRVTLGKESDYFNGDGSSRYTKWCKERGLTSEQAADILSVGRELLAGEIRAIEIEESYAQPAPSVGFDLYVRDKIASKETNIVSHQNPLEAMRSALAARTATGDIRWEDPSKLCLIDLDIKDGKPVELTEKVELRSRLQCQPSIAWSSKSGGLHLVYASNQKLSAYERACAAAVEIRELVPRLQIELLTNTRYPPATIENWDGIDGTLLWPWRRPDRAFPVSAEQIQDYLLDKGLSFGRNSHEDCPFDPCLITGQPPVEISEKGIKCYRCAAKDQRSWAYWGELLGSRQDAPRIDQAARNMVTWEHAKHIVVEDWPFALPERILRTAYVVLAVDHATPETKSLARRVTQKFGVVRGYGGIWLDADTMEWISAKVGEKRLAALPGVKFVGDDGEPKTNPILLDRYATNQNLEGWTPILAVRGIRMYPSEDKRFVFSVVKSKVKFLESRERAPWSDCVAAIRARFPGIETNYLKLCILARAYAECGEGPVPIIIVTGPSGAAKSATARIAAAMLGDRTITIWDNKDTLHSIGTHCGAAGYFLLDEFGKRSGGGEYYANIFDTLLLLERNYTYRELYVGNITKKLTSACIVTNTKYTRAALSHQQMGRRAIYLEMTRRVPKWDKLGDIDKIRDDPKFAFICDSFVSHIRDEHLTTPLSWFETASKIGFQTLEEFARANIEASLDGEILAFFKELSSNQYLEKGGWIEIRYNTDAWALWEIIADKRKGQTLGISERIRERDLIETLKYKGDDIDNRTIRFFSEIFDAGLKIRILLTNRVNYSGLAANMDVLKECEI